MGLVDQVFARVAAISERVTILDWQAIDIRILRIAPRYGALSGGGLGQAGDLNHTF